MTPPRRTSAPVLFDAGLEQDVLGAMLHSPEVCRLALEKLCPGDFGTEDGRRLFEVVAKVGEGDISRVTHQAKQMWTWEARPYIATLAGAGTSNPKLVDDMLVLRRRRALEDVSELARKGLDAVDPEQVVDLVRSMVAADPSANGWRRMSAADLLRAVYEEPRWIVPDLLPEGLCVFAARPKAGKSWMALQLAIAVATGGRFFGEQLEQGRVLYLALEDGDRRLAKRLAALECPQDVEGIHFQFGIPPIGRGGVEYLTGLVEEVDPVLVVVDTISRALETSIDQDRNSGMTAALGPLQQMALDRHLCCMLIDHLRKPDGGMSEKNPITEVMGSTAKVGVADTIWGLYRKKGERRAELSMTGRDLEDAELVVDFETMPRAWQLQGSTEQVGRSAAQKRYIDAVRSLGPTVAERVAGEVDVTVQAAREALRRLVDNGTLHCSVRQLASGGREHIYDLATRSRTRIGSSDESWGGQWWEEH